MPPKLTLALAALAIAIFASCREQWEIEDYQAGYEAEYEDAVYEICREALEVVSFIDAIGG